jgi:poly [ADP-ribose] polymerase 10/14/15
MELPENWRVMSDPWKNVEIVEVLTNAADFKDVAARFHATCSESEWRIAKIERVQNLPNWMSYQIHKRRFESRRPGNDANEKRLFHGTEKDTTPKINSAAFNRSFCGKNATVYGQGMYFAVDARYSSSNTYSPPDVQGNKYIYLARVVVGDFCVGDSSMRMPPSQTRTSDLYDSTVDKVNQPSIYVTYHDAQAYPEYLLTIRRR